MKLALFLFPQSLYPFAHVYLHKQFDLELSQDGCKRFAKMTLKDTWYLQLCIRFPYTDQHVDVRGRWIHTLVVSQLHKIHTSNHELA